MDAKYATLDSLIVTLTQDEDCCGRPGKSDQYLVIETADGGGGNYLVIRTDRWAIEDDAGIDAFAAKLKEILRAADMTQRSRGE